MRLAEIETRDPHSFDDAHWADLRKHFDEGEIIELVAAIGLFNYFNRVNDGLRSNPNTKCTTRYRKWFREVTESRNGRSRGPYCIGDLAMAT